jgi:hypothetical protein
MAQVRIELAPVVVIVAEGAPLPVMVLFVAGVPATLAFNQRSTTIE